MATVQCRACQAVTGGPGPRTPYSLTLSRMPCHLSQPPDLLLPTVLALSGASLILVVLHDILHASDLRALAHLLRIEKIHLLLKLADIALQDGLQVVGPSRRVYLLQQLPFCLQHLVLLLQEPHLRTQDPITHWYRNGVLWPLSTKGYHAAGPCLIWRRTSMPVFLAMTNRELER